ncbi:MAG: single-stranded DNA-binding protein [Oscillospiraceae bacterium]|nr:single-stranded DNA-binding protein [Oscillospiraceae bacterium]
MIEHKGENRISLQGQVAGVPQLTHRNHGVDYYTVPFRVPRLSGAEDVVNLVTNLPDERLWQPGNWLGVEGEVRSYNNRTGTLPRLVITVLVRAAQPCAATRGENRLVLRGVVCKTPVRRRTPLGREICDLLLAVNRPYGRADYLPCIAWGSLAALCGGMEVGETLRLEGRLQSRTYRKLTPEGEEMRTAYEISVMNLLPEEQPV